jgi:protein-serine/threonine kinase
MLSAPPVSFIFDDDEWIAPPVSAPRLYRNASVGSWGVTSIGRGFDWDHDKELSKVEEPPSSSSQESVAAEEKDTETEGSGHVQTTLRKHNHAFSNKSPAFKPTPMTTSPKLIIPPSLCKPPIPSIQTFARSPSSPRPRRRSSQQRVSLIAGRVSIAPIDPPSPPPMLSENLRRTPSSGSILSNASTRAPSPLSEHQGFLGGRNISEFLVEGEIGRGAYGLVKRAREFLPDGSLGVSMPLSVPVLDIFTQCILVSPPWLSNRLSNLAFSPIAGKSIPNMALFQSKSMLCLPYQTPPMCYLHADPGIPRGLRAMKKRMSGKRGKQ